MVRSRSEGSDIGEIEILRDEHTCPILRRLPYDSVRSPYQTPVANRVSIVTI
jgi:hypothetical protein